MFSEFGEYDCEREPDATKRLYVWQTAIGLQAVDGLKTSDFLRNTAQRNIAKLLEEDSFWLIPSMISETATQQLPP